MPDLTIETFLPQIHLVRGHRVMLDRDLAALYGVETRILTQAVRRNTERFPSDFMFVLEIQEVRNLISQSVTSSWGGVRKPPMAFTEQGVAMLSSVLGSPRSIQVNIQIMRAFVQLRQMLTTHESFRHKIEAMEQKYDQQFKVVFDAIKQLLVVEKKSKNKIGFTPGA